MVIFVEITKNERIIRRQSLMSCGILQYLHNQHYFQIQLQVWFYNDKILVNFR